jgi:hypothetical protein
MCQFQRQGVVPGGFVLFYLLAERGIFRFQRIDTLQQQGIVLLFEKHQRHGCNNDRCQCNH